MYEGSTDSSDNFSIELPCGYSTYYKFLKNQPKKFLCTMCGKHYIDKETCFNTPKNRLLILESELKQELENFKTFKKKVDRIETDPEFYIEKTFEVLMKEIDTRREALKKKVCAQIDHYYSLVVDRLNTEKKSIQKEFERDLKNADLFQIERLKLADIPENDKRFQFEQNLLKVKEKKVLIEDIIKNISIGENYRLGEGKPISVQPYFGKIYAVEPEEPEKETTNRYECIRGFYNHFDCIKQITYLKNDRVLSASKDQTVNLWEKDTGKYLSKYNDHSDIVTCVIFLNNQFFATGSLDKTIKIWNTSTGFCLKSLNGHTKGVLCLKLLTNGDIISGSEDKTIKIWSHKVRTLQGHTDSVNCLDETLDGTVLSASSDQTIKAWNIITGSCIFTFNGHKGEVLGVLIVDKESFASCSKDRTIKIWKLVNSKCTKTLLGHADSVEQIKKFENNDLVSCSLDGTIKIWNIDDGNCIETIQGHNRQITCIEVTEKEEIISGSIDGSIYFWSKK